MKSGVPPKRGEEVGLPTKEMFGSLSLGLYPLPTREMNATVVCMHSLNNNKNSLEAEEIIQ